MRISLLLQREPFGKIFEKTLTGFLQSRFGQSYTIKWRAASSLSNPNSQVWLCNPYLNAIFVNKVHKEVLLPVIQEFSRSAKWWRRPFQKLYVDLSTKHWTCKWFAPYIVEISPSLKEAKNLLILGGNHHIRLLDYNEGTAFVIQKVGFDRELVVNDVRVRKENPYLPSPRIHEISEDGSWYSEELILGTPINRLQSVAQGKRAMKDVMTTLSQLYEKTARKVNAAEYASDIITRIEGQIRKCSHFGRKTGDNLLKDLLELNKIIRHRQNKEIVVARTHGDFQPANILLGEEQTWLIDWEYTAERQIAYDGLVLALEARSSLGLGQRVFQAINDDVPECEQLLSTIPYVKWRDRVERCTILTLFMLEELDLKIMEVGNPMLFSLDRGFEAFWKEAKQAIQDIASMC
jgi:choline/ethanolamine kinase